MPVGTQATVKGLTAARPGRGSRRPHPARQHLPPVSAARSRTDPPDGRVAPLHVVAGRHPHRFGRFSGLQPQLAAQNHRGRRRLPLPPQWRPAHVHPGIDGGRATRLRQRYRHGARRVPGVPGEPRVRARVDAADGTMGARRRSSHYRGRMAGAVDAPRAVPHRAGLDVPGPAAGVRARNWWIWTPTVTPSAAFRWASRARSAWRWWRPPADVLPASRPRYAMGVGMPDELPEYVARGRGHDGLRAAFAQCAQRVPFHERGAGDHQARPLPGRPAAGGRELRLLHLPHLFARLPPAPLPGGRDPVLDAGHPAQRPAVP